jgi:hypothetical protein
LDIITASLLRTEADKILRKGNNFQNNYEAKTIFYNSSKVAYTNDKRADNTDN